MNMKKKGGFIKPDLGSMVWKCPGCKSFNPQKAEKCEKCGTEKPAK